MKIVKPEVIQLNTGNIYERIEAAGRTCYKSEDRITPESAEKFCKAMISNGHDAMLEHAHIVLVCPRQFFHVTFTEGMRRTRNFVYECGSFRYYSEDLLSSNNRQPDYIVSGSVRAWRESLKEYNCTGQVRNVLFHYFPEIFGDLITDDSRFMHSWKHCKAYSTTEWLQYAKRKIVQRAWYYDMVPVTFRIITDRGISHEIVRHRQASYAQESTRYCNYSKDKFNKEIAVIRPIQIKEGSIEDDIFCKACKQAEKAYFNLLQSGCTPQVARAVLPTSLKTEIVVTAHRNWWKHFIELRTDETTAHPDIVVIAKQIAEQLEVIE